ncbi:MAG: PLP-dependent aminotransferase family protein [Acidobacteria bacterium]|nr:PLP-dependent aminotransferase family protein [Acidobacteriota bacterium]MCB9397283.1 PLP-dependent aminotransferase family protein [Acidobacteriota bacterium]
MAFVYERVVDRIEELVGSGGLKVGDRIPSLRRMARDTGASLTTVIHAYHLLEDRGVIAAHPKSGFVVQPAVDVAKDDLDYDNRAAQSCLVTKAQVIKSFSKSLSEPRLQYFGCAGPHSDFLPLPQLGKILARQARQQPDVALNYAFPPGLEELRRSLALQYFRLSCPIQAKDILITNGCMEALNLSLRAVTQPGDRVLIESPTYFNVLQTLENLGLEALCLPAHPEKGICPEEAESLMRSGKIKACLLVPSFNNPIGCNMPPEARRALVDAAKRFAIPIIEDDIYGDVFLEGERPLPLKHYDSDGWVITCGSFSKTLAPGLRTGWAISERWGTRMQEIQFMSTLAVSTLGQWGLAEMLRSGHYARHMSQFRKKLSYSLTKFLCAIEQMFPKGTRCNRPAGGLVLWIRLPEGTDTFKLYREALANHISFLPGPIFSPLDEFHSYIRITFAHPWTAEVETKLARLGELASQAVST